MSAGDGHPPDVHARGGAPHAVHVRVRSAGPGAIGGVTVTVLDEQGRQVTAGPAGPDGGFTTPVPDRGAYLVIGAAPGHAPQTATVVVDGVTAASPVEFVFAGAAPGSVSGVVTGIDRRPVAGATVFVGDGQGEVVASCHTPANGAYALTDLAPGTYTVVAGAQGFRPASDLVELAGPQPARRDLVLAPEAALQGTARTADGRAVPDARVSVLDRDGRTVAEADTDEAGRYAIRGVPDGDYTVIVTGFPPVADVVRLGGDGTRHDVHLAHPDPRRPE